MANETAAPTANPQEEALFNALLQHQGGGTTTPPAGPTQDIAPQASTPGSIAASIAEANQMQAEDPTLRPFDAQDQSGMLRQAGESDPAKSALAGVAKAFFETKDTLFGEPNFEDKSAARNAIETSQAKREAQPGAMGTINGLSRNIAQFTTGMVGLGKVFKGGGYIGSAIKAATTGAVAFDPHEERLSNLIEKYPTLSNPVTRFLQADINDSKAEGRLKATLESLGVDTVVGGAFLLGAKALKLRKAGHPEEALKVEQQAQDALASDAAKKYFNDPAMQERFDERAAILEYDAGLPRDAAEAQARQELGGFPHDAPLPPANPQLPMGDAPANTVGRTAGGDSGGLGGAKVAPGGAVTEQVPPGGAPPHTKGATVLPEIEVTPESLTRMKRDNAAIEKAGGSMQQAIEDGHSFGGRESYPWQKFTGPDEFAAWMGQTIENNAVIIEKARGGRIGAGGVAVQSDKAVNAVADQYVRIFGEDPALVMGALQRAGREGKNMAAKMEAAVAISEGLMRDNYKLALQIKAENYGQFGSRAAAFEALKHQQMIAVEAVSQARALLAAAGRTMRRARGEFKARADGIQAANLNGLDGQGLVDAILSTEGNSAAMAKVGRPGTLNLIVDYAGSLLASNALWGWATHVVNTVSNVVSVTVRPGLKAVGATILQAGGKTTGNAAMSAAAYTVRRQAMKELYYSAAAVTDGWHAGVQAFLTGDSALTPHMVEAFADAGSGAQRMGTGDLTIGWKPFDSPTNLAYNAVMGLGKGLLMPLRLAGAADEMMRVIRYRAMVQAEAAIKAEERGLVAGTREFTDYMKAEVEAAFDAEGRAINAKAAAEAKVAVFAQDLIGSGTDDTWGGYRSLGAMVQQNVAGNPYLRFFGALFVKTPSNLFRQSIKLTPGLNVLQKEFQNAILGRKGVEEQAMAMGQMALGGLLAYQAAQLVSSGHVTGSGPLDPKAAREWRAEGNMPYAFYPNGKGKGGKAGDYYQFNRLDPIAGVFGMVADTMAIYNQKHTDPNDDYSLPMAIILAMAHQLGDKTYTRNISQFLQGALDPERRSQAFQQLALMATPGYALLKQGSEMYGDQYMRETYTYMDGLKALLPGYRDDLPIRYDAYGEKVLVPGKFVSTKSIDGPLGHALEESYYETGHIIQPMAPRDSVTDVDYRDIKLEDGRSAFEHLQELSARPVKGMRSLKDTLNKLVTTKSYELAPHGRTGARGTKEAMITQVLSNYRKAAKETLQRTSKMFRDKVGEEVKKNWEASVANRKNAAAEGSKAGLATYQPLLKAYGLDGIIPGNQGQ